MFTAVMRDPNLCRRVIERLLQTQIGELTTPAYEKVIKQTKDGKSIRLDIYAKEDSKNTVYDMEMQNLNRKSISSLNLPKRSRYYQSMIDRNILGEGKEYSELSESNVIFICTFDPFGYDLTQYSFEEKCDELPDLKLCDGTRKIFFNTRTSKKDIPKSLKKLYNYINSGEPSDELTNDLEKAVERARNNEELEAEYMNNSLFYTDAKNEGREEGRMEGREEGREEGRSEGIRGVIDIMLEMNCPETDIISRLMKTFGLSEEEAKTRYDEYAASNVIS